MIWNFHQVLLVWWNYIGFFSLSVHPDCFKSPFNLLPTDTSAFRGARSLAFTFINIMVKNVWRYVFIPWYLNVHRDSSKLPYMLAHIHTYDCREVFGERGSAGDGQSWCFGSWEIFSIYARISSNSYSHRSKLLVLAIYILSIRISKYTIFLVVLLRVVMCLFRLCGPIE
jgi:hypothetical protein